jgi:putative FmdB family regulatory protein
MPKYEYACKSCGERLEVVQSFTDEPLTECPACGGVLRKVFSAPSITFKGSGFYRTDSRGSRPRTETKSESSDTKASTEGKSESGKAEPAKTESAPAAESKPKAPEAKSA